MRILPVLDLLGGNIVRGIAGERERYQPVETLCGSKPNPLSIARGLADRFGLKTFYLADLDGILHHKPDFDVYRDLQEAGFRLWIDSGIRGSEDVSALLQAGAEAVILALETCNAPQLVGEIVSIHGPERILFSLDLKHGRPLSDPVRWEAHTPIDIARKAYQQGIRRMIVLDLAAVGTLEGVPTMELCHQLKAEFPDMELTTGGGIRSLSDLQQLKSLSLDAVLISSAFHNGSITVEELRLLE